MQPKQIDDRTSLRAPHPFVRRGGLETTDRTDR